MGLKQKVGSGKSLVRRLSRGSSVQFKKNQSRPDDSEKDARTTTLHT